MYPTENQPTDFDKALEAANTLAKDYRTAANDDATWGTVTGSVMIPVAAGAAFIGATSTSSSGKDAVVAAGAFGAAALGLSSWVSGKERQQAYLSGATAVQCTVDAVDHLWVHASEAANLEAEFGAAATATLADALATLDQQITALQALNPPPPVQVISRLQDLHRQGTAVLAAASNLRSSRNAATASLYSALIAVANRVNDALRRAQPDLSSLDTILVDVTKKATPVPAGTDPGNAGRSASGASSAVRSLSAGAPALRISTAVNDVTSRMAKLYFATDSTRFSAPTGPSADCLSRVFVPALVVRPGREISLVKGTDEYRFVISGGSPPYFVQKLTVDPKIDVESRTEPGVALVVVTLKGYVPGAIDREHTFMVYDRSGDENAVDVKLIDHITK